MQISQSERFKNEHKKIIKFIDSTDDSVLKNQVKSMLQDLISNVRKIDSMHGELGYVGKLSEDVSSARTKISQLRKKIFSIINTR